MKLYLWEGSIGHVSLEINEDNYISWYPGIEEVDGEKRKIILPKTKPAQLIQEATMGVNSVRFHSLQEEEEHPKLADVNKEEIELIYLDNAGALTYWNHISTNIDNSNFHLLDFNCSTVVANILTASFFSGMGVDIDNISVEDITAQINKSFKNIFDLGKFSDDFITGLIGKKVASPISKRIDRLHSQVWRPERVKLLAGLYDHKLSY